MTLHLYTLYLVTYLSDKEGPSTIVFFPKVDLNSGGKDPENSQIKIYKNIKV